MTAKATYRDTLYDSYVTGHQGEIAEDGSRASLETDVVARLPPDRATRILDIGCGQGQLVALLLEHGYADVVGIDVSAEQVELAHRLGRTTVRQADLFQFSADNAGEFDAITAIDLVEHFDRDAVVDLFRTLAQLLSPGGTLVLRTPNGASPYSGRILYSDLTHGVAYTSRSLEQVFAASGLAFVGAFPVRPAGKTPRQRVRRVLWHAIEALHIASLVVETGFTRGHVVTQNLIGVARKPTG